MRVEVMVISTKGEGVNARIVVGKEVPMSALTEKEWQELKKKLNEIAEKYKENPMDISQIVYSARETIKILSEVQPSS